MSGTFSSLERNINPLAIIQIVLEFAVIIGYVVGAFGSVFLAYYALVSWWLIPVTIANIVLSLSEDKNTTKLDMANFICGLLTLIPIFGLVPAAAGTILAGVAILRIVPEIHEKNEHTDKSYPHISLTKENKQSQKAPNTKRPSSTNKRNTKKKF